MTALEGTPALLESGDRLTRAEFHRRYCARPDIKKAELVGGVVYVVSRVRADLHGTPVSFTHFCLNSYVTLHPGLEVAVDSTLFLGDADEVQPDVCIYRQEPSGAGARLTDDGYLERAGAGGGSSGE